MRLREKGVRTGDGQRPRGLRRAGVRKVRRNRWWRGSRGKEKWGVIKERRVEVSWSGGKKK